MKEAQIVIEKWRVVYNTLRPHSSPLGAAKFNFTANGCDHCCPEKLLQLEHKRCRFSVMHAFWRENELQPLSQDAGSQSLSDSTDSECHPFRFAL